MQGDDNMHSEANTIDEWLKKQSSPILDYERLAGSRSWFLGSQPTGELVINPVVGCRYFPPGPRLLSQPKR